MPTGCAGAADRCRFRRTTLSQVVLSLQLSLAGVPLLMFTSDRPLMGVFTTPGWVRVAGGFIATAIALLDGWLVWQSLA
jgi:manganese transport protein